MITYTYSIYRIDKKTGDRECICDYVNSFSATYNMKCFLAWFLFNCAYWWYDKWIKPKVEKFYNEHVVVSGQHLIYEDENSHYLLRLRKNKQLALNLEE